MCHTRQKLCEYPPCSKNYVDEVFEPYVNRPFPDEPGNWDNRCPITGTDDRGSRTTLKRVPPTLDNPHGYARVVDGYCTEEHADLHNALKANSVAEKEQQPVRPSWRERVDQYNDRHGRPGKRYRDMRGGAGSGSGGGIGRDSSGTT